MFEKSRVLKSIKFGWQGAAQITSRSFVDYNLARTSNTIDWCYNGVEEVPGLASYRTVERFLLDKQLFFADEEPIPSCPPIRGRLKNKVKLAILRQNGNIELEFTVDLSIFQPLQLVVVFFHCEIPEISLDDLIFLKEQKWFKFSKAENSTKIFCEGIGDVDSIREAQFRVLESAGLQSIEQKSWPLFDYVQLSDTGPSVGRGPNLGNPLDLQEHWGLLVGDEGYRLIDYKEGSYAETLASADRRFRGRYVFLYHFWATSCLVFYDKDIKNKRKSWAAFYREEIGSAPDLIDYIGFTTDVPGLLDGIPIMVEICLIRYVELKRIDELISTSPSFWAPLLILRRAFGKTALEKAVEKLHRLDLYQNSSLWIIGGKYTDILFEYENLRSRLEKSIFHRMSTSSEIRSFFFTLVSFVVALAALVSTLWSKPPVFQTGSLQREESSYDLILPK